MNKLTTLFYAALCALPMLAGAQQVNSGSDGHDGALNPTSNLVIDMANHPDGIYHYTSVNIPAGVTVSFIPNAGNKPVVWLVQGDCILAGWIIVSGQPADFAMPGRGGPGGFQGGSGGSSPNSGHGLGGGSANYAGQGGNGSFATLGGQNAGTAQTPPGSVYGNKFLLPLTGGLVAEAVQTLGPMEVEVEVLC